MAAKAATFATLELLELILVNSPIASVFTATQVCRTWRETVEGSHALRCRLLTDQVLDGGDSMPLHRLPFSRNSQGLDTPDSYLRTASSHGQLLIHKAADGRVFWLFAPDDGKLVDQRVRLIRVKLMLTIHNPNPSMYCIVKFCGSDGHGEETLLLWKRCLHSNNYIIALLASQKDAKSCGTVAKILVQANAVISMILSHANGIL